jgi:ArsR family transcriptional regulator
MEKMDEFLGVFKALSDRTRLRIIRILMKAGTELCVCEIMDSLAETQYNVSRHLKELKYAGLVDCRTMGRWVFYSTRKTNDKFVRLLQKAIMEIPSDVFNLDELRLEKRLSMRKNGRCVIGMTDSQWKKQIKRLEERGV